MFIEWKCNLSNLSFWYFPTVLKQTWSLNYLMVADFTVMNIQKMNKCYQQANNYSKWNCCEKPKKYIRIDHEKRMQNCYPNACHILLSVCQKRLICHLFSWAIYLQSKIPGCLTTSIFQDCLRLHFVNQVIENKNTHRFIVSILTESQVDNASRIWYRYRGVELICWNTLHSRYNNGY